MKFNLLIVSAFLILSSLTTQLSTGIEDNPANCLDDLDVPKQFTPNGDNENEIFSIPFPCDPQSFEIQIFNRFEEELFVSKDFKFVWDGNDAKGIPCQSDVYDWKIRYMYQMNYVEVSGQVLLLR